MIWSRRLQHSYKLKVIHVCTTKNNAGVETSHKHTHTHCNNVINIHIYAKTRAHVHAPEVWHPHTFTHLDMFSSIAQLSRSLHLPYLHFLDFPRVSLYFQTTKGSSLDLSALPSVIETQLPLSLLRACQSFSQAASQSIHKLLTPAMVAHSQE